MASKSSRAFSLWRKRMGFTYHEAADALGLCRAAVGYYSVGKRKETKEDQEKDVEVPRSVLLACSAIENNLTPIGYKSYDDSKFFTQELSQRPDVRI